MPSVERQSDCCHMSEVFVLKVLSVLFAYHTLNID